MMCHFEALNFMPHLSAHICTSSRAFVNLILSKTELIALYVRQLYKLLTLVYKVLNRNGPE